MEVLKPALVSPKVDTLAIGGLSILVFALCWLLVDKGSSTAQVSWGAFYLAFLINNPHFSASYILLYGDRRREIFSNISYFWAAVLAPLLLVGYMFGCVYLESPLYLGYAVNLMYFTVGWHYVKQIYGTILVSSGRVGYFFTKQEALLLKCNLFPVWFLSYLNSNSGVQNFMHYGVSYQTFALPPLFSQINYVLLWVSLGALGWILVRKYVREGKWPSAAALASFGAIYIWYLPQVYHPHFWYLIPMFHSLQYLLFVWTLKKNQFTDEALGLNLQSTEAQRLYFVKNFSGFWILAFVTAFLGFYGIPNLLDGNVNYNHSMFGTQLFMFGFITFINIHHYFIDNVIWRRTNPMLRAYLS